MQLGPSSLLSKNPSNSSSSDVSVEQRPIDTFFSLALEEGPDTIKTLVQHIKKSPSYIESLSGNSSFRTKRRRSKEEKIVLGWVFNHLNETKNMRQRAFAKAAGISQPVLSRYYNMYHAWSALVAEGEDALEAVAGETVAAAAVGKKKAKDCSDIFVQHLAEVVTGSRNAKVALDFAAGVLGDNPSSSSSSGVLGNNPSSSSSSGVSVKQQRKLEQQQYINTLFNLAEEGPDTIKTLMRQVRTLSDNSYFGRTGDKSEEEKIVLGWAFNRLNKTQRMKQEALSRATGICKDVVFSCYRMYREWSAIVAEGKDVLRAVATVARKTAVVKKAKRMAAAKKVKLNGHSSSSSSSIPTRCQNEDDAALSLALSNSPVRYTTAFELFVAKQALSSSPVQQSDKKRKPEDLRP